MKKPFEFKVPPRGVLQNLRAMVPNLPDRTIAELKELLGLPEVHKLSFNESPYGPSPMAVEAMQEAAAGVNLYHDPENTALREELAQLYHITADMIVMGNGADDVVTLLTQALLDSGDEAIIPMPTFGQYAAAVTLTGARPVRVPVRQDMSIGLADLAEALSADTRMIFLCNPNNPTGLMLDANELREFLGRIPGDIVIVLDEAYAEYVTDGGYLSGITLAAEYPNLVVVRTFSKIYGLAGLRLGYAITHPQMADYLNKVRNPFNVNGFAKHAGLAALKDRAFTARVAELNAAERTRLTDELEALAYTVYPSQTNFLFVDLGRDCTSLCEALSRRGIIIRPGTTWNLLSHVRISLGDHRQNTLLIDALRELSQ